MTSAPVSSSAEPSWIDAARLTALVSMEDAVDTVEAAFAALRPDDRQPLRTTVTLDHGEMLLMPGAGSDVAGIKLVTVAPGNPARGLARIQGIYALFDSDTLAPVAIIDAVALTSLRTPATSAVSIRHCAVADASHLVVFGTGPQAWGHVLATAAVRPLRRVGVVARTRWAQQQFVERVRTAGWDGYAAAPADIADADVVCLCTSASEPVVDGRLLRSDAHVVAVGSHHPSAREVDTATVQRAAVVVESRSAALAEAGDLLLAIADGVPADGIITADLHEVATGGGPAPGTLTLFKSVGIALEDLAVARLAFARISPG